MEFTNEKLVYLAKDAFKRIGFLINGRHVENIEIVEFNPEKKILRFKAEGCPFDIFMHHIVLGQKHVAVYWNLYFMGGEKPNIISSGNTRFEKE